MKNIIKLTSLAFLVMSCTVSPTPPTTDSFTLATLTPLPAIPMPKDERLDAYLQNIPVRTPQPLETLPSEGVVNFQILHWNDFHGELVERMADGTWVPGAARLAAYVKAEQAVYEPSQSLILDAGDWSEGSPYTRPTRGGKVLEFYKQLGVNATTVGNHEFFYGMPRFYQLASEAAPLDILSVNFRQDGLNGSCSDRRILSPYQIYEVGKEHGPKARVAVIGVSAGNLDALVNNEAWSVGVCFQSPASSIIEIYDELMATEQPDVLIVLSHSGLDADLKIARDLNAAGTPVDIIIGGHSHDWIEEPQTVGNTYVVTAGELGRAVGEFNLTFNRTSSSLDVNWKQEIFTPCSPEDSETLAFLADTIPVSLSKRQCMEVEKNSDYEYLIDMPLVSESVGFWTLGKGTFPASEAGLVLGAIISSHGRDYPSGLFAHAPSELKFSLGGKYITFVSDITINETACGDGASFAVSVDDREIYHSKNILPSSGATPLTLDVSGGQTLKLRTISGADMSCDWTIWGDPYLIKK